MKFKGFFISFCVFAFTVAALLFGDKIISNANSNHSHIWAKTYDNNKHWEYCTECGKEKNVTNHSYKRYWQKGKETTCGDRENPYFELCSCGRMNNYSKAEYKTCNSTKKIYTQSPQYHSITCEHGSTIDTEVCVDANGKTLDCRNPGQCVNCKKVYTSNSHYMYGYLTIEPKCFKCNKSLFDINLDTTYSKDYKKVTLTVTFTILDDSVVINGDKLKLTPNPVIQNAPNYKFTKVDTGDKNIIKYTTTCDLYKSYITTTCVNLDYTENYIEVNGDPMTTLFYWRIYPYQTYKEPKITKIDVTPQGTENGWTTINKITVEGTGNNKGFVKIEIVDPVDGEVVDTITTLVKNNKFKATSIPAISALESGKVYRVEIEDANTSFRDSKNFLIKKTKCTEYNPKNEYYFDNITATKEMTIKILDNGQGELHAKEYIFNRYEKDIQLKKNGNFYENTVTLTQTNYSTYRNPNYKYEIYNKQNKLIKTIIAYAQRTASSMPVITSDIKVANSFAIDNVVYREFWIDYKKDELSKEGYFAITTTDTMPGINDWVYTDSDKLVIKNTGDYYLWFMDEAGNIGERVKVTVIKSPYTQDNFFAVNKDTIEKININKNYYTLGNWELSTKTQADKENIFLYSALHNESLSENNDLSNDNDSNTTDDNNSNLSDKNDLEIENKQDKINDSSDKTQENINKNNSNAKKETLDLTPETGDTTNIGLVIILMITSILIASTTLAVTKRKKIM